MKIREIDFCLKPIGQIKIGSHSTRAPGQKIFPKGRLSGTLVQLPRSKGGQPVAGTRRGGEMRVLQPLGACWGRFGENLCGCHTSEQASKSVLGFYKSESVARQFASSKPEF